MAGNNKHYSYHYFFYFINISLGSTLWSSLVRIHRRLPSNTFFLRLFCLEADLCLETEGLQESRVMKSSFFLRSLFVLLFKCL